MTLTTSVDQQEWAALTQRWGAVPLDHHRLAVAHPFLSGDHQQLVSDGRRAEICYVMHRGDPADGVLFHIKRFYPAGAYRLPTGGIHQGQSVLDTLAREIYEETGLHVGDTPDAVQVERFLGALSYLFCHPQLGERNFATYHFLVRMPEGATLNPQDETEQIADWRWLPREELSAAGDRLASVDEAYPRWRDWGKFRALSHYFVAAALSA
ncbi:MAG: NUDIX hydrolase [Caldilineaceae bacterium]|nr:NUDIX hydrolase [Caldilineaceae bacterium]